MEDINTPEVGKRIYWIYSAAKKTKPSALAGLLLLQVLYFAYFVTSTLRTDIKGLKGITAEAKWFCSTFQIMLSKVT